MLNGVHDFLTFFGYFKSAEAGPYSFYDQPEDDEGREKSEITEKISLGMF